MKNMTWFPTEKNIIHGFYEFLKNSQKKSKKNIKIYHNPSSV